MISIRSLTPDDEPFLWEMLYHALYVPPNSPALPPQVIQQPEISRYVEGWGRSGDEGAMALYSNEAIGAVWLRLLTGSQPGFGYVDDFTPELSIAVLPQYRGQGIGSQLLTYLLERARWHFQAVSLSVSAYNPAKHLYERLGFEVARESGTAITMIKQWS
jgi:ribosomal protein S18 acetylase RimI-like enzyme